LKIASRIPKQTNNKGNKNNQIPIPNSNNDTKQDLTGQNEENINTTNYN
jgi:hypothetical protein